MTLLHEWCFEIQQFPPLRLNDDKDVDSIHGVIYHASDSDKIHNLTSPWDPSHTWETSDLLFDFTKLGELGLRRVYQEQHHPPQLPERLPISSSSSPSCSCSRAKKAAAGSRSSKPGWFDLTHWYIVHFIWSKQACHRGRSFHINSGSSPFSLILFLPLTPWQPCHPKGLFYTPPKC